MSAPRVVFMVAAGMLSAASLSAQNPTSARIALSKAAGFLKNGNADSALATYADALRWSAGDQSAAAEAYFGMATAKGRITDAEGSRIEEFLQAATLDSSRYFVAGYNNAAQVARSGGDHARSARLFTAAGQAKHPAKSYILLDAGREWLRAERADSALVAIGAAVRADPGNAGAVASLAELARERRRPGLILALAEETRDADAAVQELVADALVHLMAGPDASTSLCDTTLLLLAPALARMGADPDLFAFRFRRELVDVAKEWNHAGVAALVAAYERAPSTGNPPPWWRSTQARRVAWTRTMTSLGTRFDERGRPAVARRYYEAALGFPTTRIEEPWLDLDALLPLARIYAELPEKEFDVFQQWAFEEKGNMYDMLRFNAPRAVPILRRLHLSLGIVFARRGQWGRHESDIYGAAFQLLQMREFTTRMRADGTSVSDPPEALEQLVYALWAVDRKGDAMALAPDVIQAYRARGDMENAARLEMVVGQPARLDRIVKGG